MSLLIVTSRYLKSGTAKTKSQRKNYTKYIATRESVEIREQSKKYSTQNQKKLLNELLNDFPETKKYLEFEDYKNNPTAENASELIGTIIERNADVIGNRQNFVGYMAMRPGVEKRGAHGLFNESNEPIVLDQVAEEVANHPGNVWSHVVSLRREDVIRLGYDNSDRWRELVIKCISSWYSDIEIRIANLIREYDFYRNCWVISFNHNYLTKIKEYDQHINTALMYVGCISDEKSYWKRTKADGVEVCIDYFTADTAENAHKLGLKLIGWCTEDFCELDKLISHDTDIITIEQEDRFLNYIKNKRGDIM